MRNRRWFTGTTIILTLLLSVLLLGCEAPTERTLGAVLSLSGSGSAYGVDIKKGMDFELERINAAGGVGGLPLRIVMEDSGSNPEKGAAATKGLLEQKVSAIIGGDISSVTLAAAPLAEAAGVVLLSPASSNPAISSAGNYIFRIYPSDVVEGTMVAGFALNVMGLNRIMVLAMQNDYGQGLKTVFIKRYREVPNREILQVLNFQQGQTDWSAELAAIQEKGPDGIYLVGYSDEMLGFLRVLREANIRTPVLASRAFTEEMAEDPSSAGVIFPRDEFDPQRNDRATAFAEGYRAKYNEEPNIWAANGADCVKLLAEAIESVGAKKDSIRAYLSQVREWEGASGLVSFDSNGDVDKRPIISIVHEGKFIGFKDYQALKGQG